MQEALLLRVRQRASSSVLINVSRVAWALSHSSQVFVRAELRGLSYQTSRDRDHTGGPQGPGARGQGMGMISRPSPLWPEQRLPVPGACAARPGSGGTGAGPSMRG
jgi:hypothetical protein